MINNSNKFDKAITGMASFRKELHRMAAVEAAAHFRNSFDNEGFTDKVLKKWKERAYNPPNRSRRKTLTGTRRLRRSIRISTYNSTLGRVVAGSGVAYAKIHNEGGEITITAKMRRFFWAQYKETGVDYFKNMALRTGDKIVMPKRQYMGDSRKLNNKIMARAKSLLTNYMSSKFH
jgi:phage gpG-like protein